MDAALTRPLLRWRSSSAQAALEPVTKRITRSLAPHVCSLVVAGFCILVGVLHPLLHESAKTARLITCDVRSGNLLCGALPEPLKSGRRVMPFHAATLSITAEFLSVTMSLFIVAHHMGSVRSALLRLFNSKMLSIVPIGLIYGLGDLMQTLACNSASVPVVMVVGQSKLLLAALLSCMLISRQRTTNWFRLIIISCAAAASTDISAGIVAVAPLRAAELHGAALSLVKAGLSSTGAVISELFFKKDGDNFWVVSFRVQFMMLMTSLLLLPWTTQGWSSTAVSEFFSGGPLPLCSEVEASGCLPDGLDGTVCTCVDRRGWDAWTLLATLGIVLNGMSTGLILKHHSAVTKSVCNAMSTGVFYIAYVMAGFRPFSVAQANVIAIVIISSYEYAMEMATPPREPDAKRLPS